MRCYEIKLEKRACASADPELLPLVVVTMRRPPIARTMGERPLTMELRLSATLTASVSGETLYLSLVNNVPDSL